jgi:hypothetical protein
MKKKWILMLAVVMLFAFTAGVVAAPDVQQITAKLANDVKITLNGNAWTPKDADGSTMVPISYKGRTYLPVRAIGEALGVKVDWNSETRTVILGEAAVKPEPKKEEPKPEPKKEEPKPEPKKEEPKTEAPTATASNPGDVIKAAITAFSATSASFEFNGPIAGTPFGDIAAKLNGTAKIDASKKGSAAFASDLGALDKGDKTADACPFAELIAGPEGDGLKIVANGKLSEEGNNYVITLTGVPCPASVVAVFSKACKLPITHELTMDCKIVVDKSTGKISAVENINLKGQAKTALGSYASSFNGNVKYTY